MIKWNDGLNLGVKIVDDEHKELLRIINNLSDAINNDKTKDTIHDIFSALEKYALVHFENEEALLKKCNYPFLQEHHNKHNEFTLKVPELKAKLFTSGDEATAKEVVNFLIDWLFNHIIEEDIPLLITSNIRSVDEKITPPTTLLNRLIQKITDTLSFTKRLLLSAITPLIGMFLLILIILIGNYYKHETMKATSSVTNILSNINNLIHVIQVERGLSCGYISSKDTKFEFILFKQREEVDNTVDKFKHKVKTVDTKELITIASYLETFQTDILTLNVLRKKIDLKNISQDDILNHYTKIIENILNITLKISLSNLDKEISSSISTLSSILQYKEALGLKRAIGTSIIEKNNIQSSNEYTHFLKLIGSQKVFLNYFKQTATSSQKKLFDEIMKSQIVQKINSYEKNIQEHNLATLDSIVWFNTMTELIDLLKNIEDDTLKNLEYQIQDSLEQDVYNLSLWLIFTTLIFLITLFIIYIFDKSSKEEIYRVITAMKDLAKGGRAILLKQTQKKDEMSQMYLAYEITRQKLLKGDLYTELYFSQKEIEINERKKENKKLEKMASIDSLTGCINRRKFEELSNLELKRSLRYKNNLSFLMLDIDHFKAVNDTYGHAIGDEVLKHFSSVCLEMARDLDIVARIGGEEFVVMLPQTDNKGAFVFAERFRKEIYNTTLTFDEHIIKYSVSIGVAILNDNEDTVKNILQRADKALYKAKDSGRNQTIF